MSEEDSIPFDATMEEALSLLDLVLLIPLDLSPCQQRAVHKLADFCREGFRGAADTIKVEQRIAAAESHASRSPANGDCAHLSKHEDTL